MNNTPLVSVIIPVYMAEKYIRNTINSVLLQTYKNVEIICIIDYSTDRSYEICAEMSEVNERVKVYRNVDENGNIVCRNLGQEATRNYGLDIASGEYFIFLDADDTLDPYTLQSCVERAEKFHSDIVMFTFSKIVTNHEIPVQSGVKEGLYDITSFSKLLLDPIPWSIISCIGSKLYRSEKFKGIVYFDKKYKYNEDCAFALEALLIAKNVMYVDEPYYKYLIRESESIMSSYRPNMFNTNKKVVELTKAIFKKSGCFDEKKDNYYSRFFFLMMDSLINEINYGTQNSFRDTVNEVINYQEFGQIENSISNQYKWTTWQHWFIKFLAAKQYNVLSGILHVRKVIESKNLVERIEIKIRTIFYRKFYRIGCRNDKNSRVYMFHNIDEVITDPEQFVSSIKGFELFLQQEQLVRKPVNIENIIVEKEAYSISFDDGYESVYKLAYPVLKRLNIPFTIFITYDFLDKVGYLTREQLMVLKNDSLCTIGCHTISHSMLRYDINAKREIEKSKELLENEIKQGISVFAYPYGSIYACSSKNILEAKSAGFSMAFSAVDGVINTYTKQKRFFLPRIDGDNEVEKLEIRRRNNETGNSGSRV